MTNVPQIELRRGGAGAIVRGGGDGMKLYVWGPAPNPRRVQVYLAEKGIEVPTEDVGEGFALRKDFLERWPHRTVPMLELDDGTQIGEAMAICRYFEALHPDPSLMGTDPKNAAIVEMWERRANDEGLLPIAEILRNTHPAFKDRGMPGYPRPVRQVAELVERARERLDWFFEKFDRRLGESEFLAGDRYTVADVTAQCAVDFGRAVKLTIPEERQNLRRWHEAVSKRPSAAAGR